MVDKLMAIEPLGSRKAMELLTTMQMLRLPRDDQFFAWTFLQLAHDDHTYMRKLAEKADGLLALQLGTDSQLLLYYFHVRARDKEHRCEEPCAWP
jgi:hypothetical protein